MSLLYQDAHNTLEGLAEDANTHLEWASTRFWKYLLEQVFFEARWIIASQQPPTKKDRDLRRVDIVIETIRATSHDTVLFLKAKKPNASQSDIEMLEYQAYVAACAYSAATGKPRVWAMTSVGTKARLWIFNITSRYLLPFFPDDEGSADIDKYFDTMSDLPRMTAHLEFIKDNITPPMYLLDIVSSPPRPANAMLPGDWHDDEVRQVDDYRQDYSVDDRRPRLPVSWRPREAGSAACGPSGLFCSEQHQLAGQFEDTESLYLHNAAGMTRITQARIGYDEHGKMAIHLNGQWVAGPSWQRAKILIGGRERRDSERLGSEHTEDVCIGGGCFFRRYLGSEYLGHITKDNSHNTLYVLDKRFTMN
ncbi:hypothetical protein F5B20DRAFT_404342 [Whalleya microplaca]|nr:hypothetical protein F5B20DRAFT_404342 [Whalleya microplaca]